MSGVILIGGGGHCHSVIDVLECAGVPIAGIVHGPSCALDEVLGYPALGRDDDLPKLRDRYDQALITVGQIKSPALRQRLFAKVQELNFTLPTVVSPLAHVSRHASIGAGCVVMHQALVNAGATIGDNVIINTDSLVEHDCTIGSHCHIAIGAILGGNVTIGDGTFIGAGAVVREGVKVDNNCIVGMNSKVLSNLSKGIIHTK